MGFSLDQTENHELKQNTTKVVDYEEESKEIDLLQEFADRAAEANFVGTGIGAGDQMFGQIQEERDDLSDLENDIMENFDESRIEGGASGAAAGAMGEPSMINHDVTNQSFRSTSIYADLLKQMDGGAGQDQSQFFPNNG